MWGILFAAFGLAALVDRSKEMPTHRYGPIICRLPLGWVTVEPLKSDSRLVVCVQDPQSQEAETRQLAIYCDIPSPSSGPGDYLRNSGLLEEISNGIQRAELTDDAGKIAGASATRIDGTLKLPTPDGGTEDHTPMLGLCAVLPDHLVITVVIWHDPDVDADDNALLNDVAASISEAGK